MSILSALSENRHEKKNLAELAKLPQALIMQMGQRKELTQEEIAMIISKKAEAIESAARQKALEQGGGQMPSVMEQDMMKIAQAENPAPQQVPQQMMPQQMAQAQQLPEDVGIAQNPTPPMQLAGGGIIAFEGGGDVDYDYGEEDDYQDLIDQAAEDAAYDEMYELTDSMEGDAGVGIMASRNVERSEDKGDLASRLRAQIMQKESGGRRYDKDGKLLTSSKGALGEMQVMPGTARDPGFGIKPAKNVNDPNELSRVGNEYVNALLNKYQDPMLTMIAYNMGPGATDKWLANGADPRKLPKETQGYIRGVSLAGGGEVKRFDIGGEIDTAGAELDALRKGTTELERALGGSRGDPGLRAAYENALALRKQKEAQYEALMNKAGVNKASFFPQSSLSTKRPEANPMVKRESVGAAPVVNVAPAQNLAPDTPPPPPMQDNLPPGNGQYSNTQGAVETADKDVFNLMKYIKEREAKQEKAAENDYNIAGLAAGLGMIASESPYPFVGIGQGGLKGVQQLAQLQKMRASQGIASDKLIGTAANQEMLNRYRKDSLAQNERKYDEDRAQRLTTAKSAELGRRLKLKGLTDELIANLEQKEMLKTIKPEEAAKLKLYKEQMQRIKNDVNKEFASSTGGYSARRIGQ